MKKGGQSCREKGYLIYIGKGSENEKNGESGCFGFEWGYVDIVSPLCL